MPKFTMMFRRAQPDAGYKATRAPQLGTRKRYCVRMTGLLLVLATAHCGQASDPASIGGEICDVLSQRAKMCPYEPFPGTQEECVNAYECGAYLYGESYAKPFIECAAAACKPKGGPEQYEPCVKDKSKSFWSRTDKSSAQKDFEAACVARYSACAGQSMTPASPASQICMSFPVQFRDVVFADLTACLSSACGAIEACFEAATLKKPYCPDK